MCRDDDKRTFIKTRKAPKIITIIGGYVFLFYYLAMSYTLFFFGNITFVLISVNFM